MIDGFESPFGMELLATVDWLISEAQVAPTIADVRRGIREWPADAKAAARKERLFDDRLVGIAIQRLEASGLIAAARPGS